MEEHAVRDTASAQVMAVNFIMLCLLSLSKLLVLVAVAFGIRLRRQFIITLCRRAKDNVYKKENAIHCDHWVLKREDFGIHSGDRKTRPKTDELIK
jgi:hypothetical protein